tara:strand:+ start:234 stop:365 length:132 start_codon:yes stop_codon:yes gene_type:complete
MDELAVTRLWMYGVVASMVVFGLFALVGYYRLDREDKQTKTDD